MGFSRIDYNGETLMDVSGVSVTEDTLGLGETAINANGDPIIGRAVFSSSNSGSSECLFKVTCEMDFTTMEVVNVSHSLSEINNAFEQGKMVILCVDLSAIGGGSAVFQLATVSNENSSFMGQMYMEDIYFICVTVHENYVNTLMVPLAPKTS